MALLGKWGWLCISNLLSPWKSVIEAKYLKGRNFFEVDPKLANSWWSKGILKSKLLLEKVACICVNAEEANLCFDPQIPGLPTFKPFFIGNLAPRISLVKHLWSPSLSWNRNLLTHLFDRPTIRSILNINISDVNASDSWLWPASPTDSYTVKMAYNLLCQELDMPLATLTSLYRFLWKTKLHQRLKVLWWQALTNSIPTKSKLNSLFPIAKTSCTLCSPDSKSIIHFFQYCEIEKFTWRSSEWGLLIDCLPFISVTNWMRALLEDNLSLSGWIKKKILSFATVTLDEVWKCRNKAMHDTVILDKVTVANRIHAQVAEFTTSQLEDASTTLSQWSPHRKTLLNVTLMMLFGKMEV